MSAFFVYITASDKAEALQIARALVDSRYAACANVCEKVTSVYRWEGQLREDTESVLIVKTRAELLSPLIEKVNTMHSYDCPCIVALPIHDGNPEFLDWIETETRDVGA
ncbi:MAG: divalent-cation tolerance protein CutA [Alphaproteobacteria bacterium]